MTMWDAMRRNAMIRNDFVSNSSSTSYVVYFNTKDCDIDKFINTVCDNCTTNPKVFRMNKISLSYHLEYSRLLFLGEVYVKDIEYDFDKTKVPEWEDKKWWESDFNSLRDMIKEKGKNNHISKCGIDYTLVNDHLIHETEHYYIGELIDDAENRYFNYFLHCANDEVKYTEDVKENLNNLIAFCSSDNYLHKINIQNPYIIQTYVIDKNTIWLTEFMLKNGYKMKFEKWEDLDKIKKILEDGNTIITLRVNDHGCGQESDAVYYMDDERKVKVFHNIPVTILSNTAE